MKNYFEENIDKNRLSVILDIKMKYAEGAITLEEGRKTLREKLGKITPMEIAATEQELTKFQRDQCQKEDIQAMTILFVDLLDTARPELPKGHPILHYYMENDELRLILEAIEDLVQYPVIKNQWYELYDRLAQLRIHFSRKQNQLYSVLEKKGFTRPTTTMWTLDDFVRDEISSLRELLDKNEDEFIKEQATLVADVRDLMEKEEKILYPTSLAMISDEEFEEMKEGDDEIGFAWIDVAPAEVKTSALQAASDSGFMKDLGALLAKYNMANDHQELDVKTGKLSLDQINLIYQHMPVDFSYVDENEIVKFYTDTKHRIFPRSKNVIGRDVKNCHPRNSVHIVEEIVEKFRSGEQSEAEFWINKPGLFIYIKYVAVRDQDGKFRGVLEMMQDCTHIRSLEGSQTLLNWSNERSSEAEVEQESMNETKTEENAVGTITAEELNENTRLEDLLKAYPELKQELPKINPAFSRLNTPLARVLIPKATVKIMSEKSGMPLDELLQKLKNYIGERKA
ncbi:MAG: PAS domain-containing protein [Peptostreptococcaceae bacterium]|nr:PAS domain-containing protein [Peptostreptococcaceae bacterium]